MKNIFKNHLESFFLETSQIEANLKIMTMFSDHGYDKLNKEFPFNDYQLYGMITTFRDFSQLEGGDNLYNTNIQYDLSTNTLQIEHNRLKNYITCLTITQAFEVFESYLKNVLATTINAKPQLLETLRLDIEDTDFKKVRDNLYKIQGRSCKGFFKALRKISPFYKEHETGNIWKRNMARWFDLVSDIRNLIIHSRLSVTQQFIEKQKDPELKKLFDLYFHIEEDKDSQIISLSVHNASELITNLYGLAFLIYKSLCIDLDFEIDSRFKSVMLK